MAQRRLDMLPLLDVFMVVLFAITTTTTADDEPAQSQPAQTPSQTEALAEARSASDRARAALDEAQRASRDAALRAEALADALEDLRKDAQRRGGSPRESEVLERLLDQFSVFEIEVAGEPGDAGVRNRCCFRSDLADQWRSCGEVPALQNDRRHWLEDGGDGLLEVLRKTKGGNALTLVRQDEDATYRIAGALEEALRDRLPDHRVYNEGVSLATPLCPLDPGPAVPGGIDRRAASIGALEGSNRPTSPRDSP